MGVVLLDIPSQECLWFLCTTVPRSLPATNCREAELKSMRSGKNVGAQRLGSLRQGAGAGTKSGGGAGKWQGATGRLAQDDTELRRLHASGDLRRSVRHHDKEPMRWGMVGGGGLAWWGGWGGRVGGCVGWPRCCLLYHVCRVSDSFAACRACGAGTVSGAP